ncbi:MAG: NYN domain-containing protein [Pirellula sp.]
MEKLAVFVDYENFRCSPSGLEMLFQELSKRGPMLLKRVCADWVRCVDSRKLFLAEQADMIEVPNSVPGKNSVDIRLVVDAMEYALCKEYLTTFVIVSADADFLPLLQRLREYNKKTIVVSASHTASALIKKNCDEYINGDVFLNGNAVSKPGVNGKPRAKAKSSLSGSLKPSRTVGMRTTSPSPPSRPTTDQMAYLKSVILTAWAACGYDRALDLAELSRRMRGVDSSLTWKDFDCKNFQSLVAHLVTHRFLRLELGKGNSNRVALVNIPAEAMAKPMDSQDDLQHSNSTPGRDITSPFGHQTHQQNQNTNNDLNLDQADEQLVKRLFQLLGNSQIDTERLFSRLEMFGCPSRDEFMKLLQMLEASGSIRLEFHSDDNGYSVSSVQHQYLVYDHEIL